jgi:DNA processing protein
LFRRIARDGMLISEFPPDATPQRHRFLVRNRLIAGLSAGTVVVEAGVRSGALRMGRAVMAVPGPVTSAESAGVHELLRTRPDVILVTRTAEPTGRRQRSAAAHRRVVGSLAVRSGATGRL